jgi:2-oxo-4-hydroxy-4-carboxy--5-ureidoimidazoline (OHCU) decarboxylase
LYIHAQKKGEIMTTLKMAKELKEEERRQTIEVLENINKDKEYFTKYYEAYKEGFGMGYLIAEQGEHIGHFDNEIDEYIEHTWKQFFIKKQKENNE